MKIVEEKTETDMSYFTYVDFRNTATLSADFKYLKHLVDNYGSISIEPIEDVCFDSEQAKRENPRILDGKIQHKDIQWIYITPLGLIPRSRDIATLLGVVKQTVNHRVGYIDPKYKDWGIIHNPKRCQIDSATRNVNNLYTKHFYEQDSCSLCNAIDDLLFKEDCWLVDTTHTCGKCVQHMKDIQITYSYKGADYQVTLLGWYCGNRPHISDNP